MIVASRYCGRNPSAVASALPLSRSRRAASRQRIASASSSGSQTSSRSQPKRTQAVAVVAPDELGAARRHDERHRRPDAPELPVGGRGAGEPEQVPVGRRRHGGEQSADPAAPQRAHVAGEIGGRRGLGLGQVVALGVVGQRGLDDVERRQVRLVPVGPGDPEAEQRARGEVDGDGVLDARGQHEEQELGAALDGQAVAAPEVAGRAPICSGPSPPGSGSFDRTAADRAPKCARTCQLPGSGSSPASVVGLGRGRSADEAPAHVGGAVGPVRPQRRAGALAPGQHRTGQPAFGGRRRGGRAGHRRRRPRPCPRRGRRRRRGRPAPAGWRRGAARPCRTSRSATSVKRASPHEGAQSEERDGGDRVGRRHGAVLELRRADDERVGVVAGR